MSTSGDRQLWLLSVSHPYKRKLPSIVTGELQSQKTKQKKG